MDSRLPPCSGWHFLLIGRSKSHIKGHYPSCNHCYMASRRARCLTRYSSICIQQTSAKSSSLTATKTINTLTTVRCIPAFQFLRQCQLLITSRTLSSVTCQSGWAPSSQPGEDARHLVRRKTASQLYSLSSIRCRRTLPKRWSRRSCHHVWSTVTASWSELLTAWCDGCRQSRTPLHVWSAALGD